MEKEKGLDPSQEKFSDLLEEEKIDTSELEEKGKSAKLDALRTDPVETDVLNAQEEYLKGGFRDSYRGSAEFNPLNPDGSAPSSEK